MRPPSFRIAVRTLLLLVAVAGIALGALVLARRSDEYRRHAALYAKTEQIALSRLNRRLPYVATGRSFGLRRIEVPISPDDTGRVVSELTAFVRTQAVTRENDVGGYALQQTEELIVLANEAEHAGALRRKYEAAARRPWLAIPPDPPPPGPEERARYWLSRGEYGRALRVYEETISSYPHLDSATVAYNNRAWIWATCPDSRYRDGPRAVESATVACVRTGCTKVSFLSTLAAAYAECGDFELAVRWQKDALSRVHLESPEWRELDQRLQQFLRRRSYRDVEADRN